MNKQEILEYINYKGKYTKDVKTKLNKLIKNIIQIRIKKIKKQYW